MHPKAGEPVGLPETPSSIDLYKKQDLCTYWNEQTPRAHHVTLLVPYPGKSRHPDHPNPMSGSESGPRGSPHVLLGCFPGQGRPLQLQVVLQPAYIGILSTDFRLEEGCRYGPGLARNQGPWSEITLEDVCGRGAV